MKTAEAQSSKGLIARLIEKMDEASKGEEGPIPMILFKNEAEFILECISAKSLLTEAAEDVFRFVYKKATGEDLSDEKCDELLHDFIHDN